MVFRNIRYKNLDRSFFGFVTMHAFDRRTDGQLTSDNTALHSVQRGKTSAIADMAAPRSVAQFGFSLSYAG